MRKNRFTSAATDADIENVAKDWFRFAKDRYGGRKERERKKMAELKGQLLKTETVKAVNF